MKKTIIALTGSNFHSLRMCTCMMRLMTMLSKAGLVSGLHGKGGGYRLVKKPSEYTIGSILKHTESSLAPVACLKCSPVECERAGECRTLPMWTKLDKLIDDFFEGITLEDIIDGNVR